MLNPQYKNLNLYDKDMNELNTNKPLQGLEQDNSHEKNNVRQQNISRVYNPKGPYLKVAFYLILIYEKIHFIWHCASFCIEFLQKRNQI